MSTTPYENQKINTRDLTSQLIEMHGSAFNPLMHSEGHLEGVLTFGPPGIGKTQSTMAGAKQIAADNGAELVIYRPGVRPDPSKKQILFVHMSMAGMTSGGVLGFPTVSANDKVDSKEENDKIEKQRRFVSQQVIPEVWRSAMEFESAIYLFDEITHVISQEALLSLLSEGFYGETELAKRTLFIATANEGVSDGTLQQKLSTAFRNRFTSYYIKADVKQWRQDFANKTVHPALLAYASMYPDRFENWKTPEHNLLNAPTLRGITLMSDALTFFEARNFRDKDSSGQLNPRGEWKENVKFTPEHANRLMKLAFGRLGHEGYAQDFVNMYELAYKTVMPEINKAIGGKFKEISDEFKEAIALDTDVAVKKQKAALSGNSSDRLKDSQNNIAKAFTYVDYTPRMFLDAMINMPNNEKVKAHARQNYPKMKQDMESRGQKIPDWGNDAPMPAEILRTYGVALLNNFVQAIMLLPSNMQMMSIQHLRELSSTQECKDSLKAFRMPQSSPSEEIVLPLLIQLLTAKNKDPEYARLYDAFNQNAQATSVISQLGS